MKSYNYRFEKVLMYREQQKSETEIGYKNAIQDFETVATELYDLLKKKEMILDEQNSRMETGFQINEIHHYARYVASLEKNIAFVQQKVIQARSKMNWFEDKLLERTIEVKKFEKMKENDLQQHQEELLNIEAKQLDELATLKFKSGQTGW